VVRKAASGGSAAKETKMTSSTSFNWFKRLLVLGSVVAVAAALAAGASGAVTPSAAPDVFERYAAAHPYGSTSVPDVFERYAAAHPYGVGALAPAQGTERIVDDWFRDPAVVAAPARRGIGDFPTLAPAGLQVGDRIVDDSFRDPQPIATPAGDWIVDDYFRDAPTVVTSAPGSDALDWGDFGIGAGAMLGLTLLVAGLGLGAVAMRHHRGERLKTS
jgi:hypothetical protein